MPAKEQDSFFRLALTLHQQSSDETSLREALNSYKKARNAAPQTFPIAFNIAAVCLDLSQSITSEPEAHSFRKAAADSLEEALALLPANLEALIARAAVEDAFARNASDAATVLSHRANASRYLKLGAAADPADPGVRILLAEALIQHAEAAAEVGNTIAPGSSPRELLVSADMSLKQAAWLVGAKLSDLSRMATDPNAIQELHKRHAAIVTTRAKLVIAMVRGTEVAGVQAFEELRNAEAELKGGTAGESAAETLLLRSELFELMSQCNTGSKGVSLNEALILCRESIRAFEAQASPETREQQYYAQGLLGDICLACVQMEPSGTVVAQFVNEGTRGYKTALRGLREGIQVSDESEILYNMVCLVVLGMASGCTVGFSERQVVELLKRSVDCGGTSAEDLLHDKDMAHIRKRDWFKNLLQYSKRQHPT